MSKRISGWPAWLAVVGIVLLSAGIGGFVVLRYAQPCICIFSPAPSNKTLT